MTTPQQRRAAEAELAGSRRTDPQPPSPELPLEAWIPQTGELVGYTLDSGPHAGELRPAIVLRAFGPGDLPAPKVRANAASFWEILRGRGVPVPLFDKAEKVGLVDEARLAGVLRLQVQTDPELDGLPVHVVWAAWSPVAHRLHWSPLPEPARYQSRCRLFDDFLGELSRCLLHHGHTDRCWLVGSPAREATFRGPERAPGTSSSA